MCQFLRFFPSFLPPLKILQFSINISGKGGSTRIVFPFLTEKNHGVMIPTVVFIASYGMRISSWLGTSCWPWNPWNSVVFPNMSKVKPYSFSQGFQHSNSMDFPKFPWFFPRFPRKNLQSQSQQGQDEFLAALRRPSRLGQAHFFVGKMVIRWDQNRDFTGIQWGLAGFSRIISWDEEMESSGIYCNIPVVPHKAVAEVSE